MEVLTGDTAYVIAKFLDHLDIVNFCRAYCKNWSKLYKIFLEKVAENIDKYFRIFFGTAYLEFVKNMKEGKAVVSGSFIIQTILNETWDPSDIDIYHSYNFNWRKLNGNNLKYWSPLENQLYLLAKRNGNSASQDYDFLKGKNEPLIIRRICEYTIQKKKIQVLQFKKVMDTNEIYDLLKQYSDFDICKNIFYYDENGYHVKIYNASDIINKQTDFKFTTRSSESEGRAKKYKKRGIDFPFTMCWAGLNGNLQDVKMFLQKGKKIKEINETMVWAAKNSHTEIVKLMIENGADNFDDALVQASKNEGYLKTTEEQLNLIKFLIEKIKDPDIHMRWAIDDSNADVVHMLLEKGATNFLEVLKQKTKDKKNYLKGLLHKTAIKEYYFIFKSVIEAGINDFDLPWNYRPCITEVACKGNIDLVKWMIDKGCKQYLNIMIGAAEGGHIEILKLGIANNDKDFDIPLGRAAEKGHLEIVKFITSEKQKLNIKSALILAAYGKKSEVVNYLNTLK